MEEIEADKTGAASYFQYGCCSNLSTYYQIHICSVLKFYENFYKNIETAELDSLGLDIESHIYFQFDEYGVLASTDFGSNLPIDQIEIFDRALQKTLKGIRPELLLLDREKSRKKFTLEFKYYANSNSCLKFPQKEDLKDCVIDLSSFDANLYFEYKKISRKSIDDLSDQTLNISVRTNDYMWDCYKTYRKPHIRFKVPGKKYPRRYR